jgi:hypothetical protein
MFSKKWGFRLSHAQKPWKITDVGRPYRMFSQLGGLWAIRTVRFDAGRAPFRECCEEVARTRPLDSHLSALPLQRQRVIPSRVLRRQQAEERKAPYIAIIGKEGDDCFVL